MDDTDSVEKDQPRMHRNKYPQGQSGLYHGLVNRIKNSGCDRELLEKMVNTAAEREQIRSDEKQKLLQMIENKFRTDGTPDQDSEKQRTATEKGEGRRKKHGGHHSGSELAIRQLNPNIRGTGPLGVNDFHHHRVRGRSGDMRLNRK